MSQARQAVRRALFVTTVPTTLQAFLRPFAAYFRERNWKVDAAAAGLTQFTPCRDAFEEVFDLPLSRSVTSPANFVNASRAIRDIVKRGAYDVVHVHTPIASFLTRFALRKERGNANCVVIYTAHGFHFFKGNSTLKNFVFYNAERWGARWTDYLFTINQEDFRAAQTFKTIPVDRVKFSNGIGVDVSHYQASLARSCLPGFQLPAGARYVLMIAELIKRKRPWDALAALAKINDASVHLLIAGEGPLLGNMRALAKDLTIEQRVHFLGFRSDVPALLRGASALVLPSAQEGLPRCVMESFCAEIPVVATNIRGTRDVLSGGAGFLVEVGQPAEIAQAICTLLTNEKLRIETVRNAKAKVAHYSFDSVIQEYAPVYENGVRRNLN